MLKRDWKLDLCSRASPGGIAGAVNYRHKACGGLHGVSNILKVSKAHKCYTESAINKKIAEDKVFCNLS
jgi:hypothetical protein